MTAANLATYRPLIRSIARSVRSGPNTDASPAAAAGDNSIINLSKIRWPRSRSSRSAATGGYPRAGYILSDDERDDDDGLVAWEHELGLGGRTTAGSSVDDKSQPHVVRVGSEEQLTTNSSYATRV